jgi:GT2 family glycosyltransferase
MRAPATAVNVGKVRKAVSRAIPAGSRVGVVSDGHRELLSLTGSVVVPVPRAADGRPASDVPRNDLSAIAHVESLRVTQIDQLVVPEPSLWLTIVPGLRRHLEARYATLSRSGDAATIFDVRAPRSKPTEHGEEVHALLRRCRERLGREPSVLDWDSGASLAADGSAMSSFAPPATGTVRELPYVGGSIDVVLVPDGDPDRYAEARRVASLLVIAIDASRPDVAGRVEWLGGEADADATSVSIVIPTWNDVTMIAACLRTLDETAAHRDVEVIVSDDGSEASFGERLEALSASYANVRLLRNPANRGYIGAVNAGAAMATKDVLVFLNNDTILLPGWLDPLVDTLRDRPRTGVVGGMLLYPDGRLQEAGCAIFRDGSATKVGFGDSDPTLPYYAHPRSVDYVSGALLATPRSLFERLGGLDPAFGFGYYEDGDYCFRVRREGLDVAYQPKAVIVHVEGGTAGTDLTKGAKRYQAINQALFVERWRDELAGQPERPEPLDIHASRDLVIRAHAPSAP